MKLIPVILLLAVTSSAQRHKLATINAATEDGKLLQSISTEQDPARQLKLMEQFQTTYAKHEAGGWVGSQLQQAYLKGSQWDKAIETGERLLMLDALDFDAAYANLQAAEGKKDAEAVMKWAAVTSEAARQDARKPKAAEQSDEDHKRAIASAKQAETYAEYALSAAAVNEADAAKAVRLVEALEQRNPQSQYFAASLPKYAWAAGQSKQLPSAAALTERAWTAGVYNEDLLLTMADYHMQQTKDAAKVVRYSEKVVEILNTKPKPEGVSDADWGKKKGSMLGLANWMAGTTLAGQNKHPEADKALRAALPHIQDNEQLRGTALFYLGLSNYQLGKSQAGKGQGPQQMSDALQFMQQAAAVKGPLQAKAQSNLLIMRREIPPRKK